MSDESTDIDTTLQQLVRRLESIQADRQALPCFRYQEADRIPDAVDACEEAGAQPGCQFSRLSDCPREIEAAPRNLARQRLEGAGVPESLHAPLLRAMPRRTRPGSAPVVPLQPTDPLRATRGFLRAEACGVTLASGVSLAFTGNEWALVLGGSVGSGKSLAGAWAIRERGGMWVHSSQAHRPEVYEPACKAAFVVLDDVGDEWTSEAGYASTRLAAILAARHAASLRTILTTNLTRPAFRERYGKRTDDRLRERARWVELAAESLRGQP